MAETEKQTDAASKLQEELSSVRQELIQKESEKDQLVDQVRQQAESINLLTKSKQELEEEMDHLKKMHQEQLADRDHQHVLLKKDLTSKDEMIYQLQQQVQQLQPFPEALEEEKQKHIKVSSIFIICLSIDFNLLSNLIRRSGWGILECNTVST